MPQLALRRKGLVVVDQRGIAGERSKGVLPVVTTQDVDDPVVAADPRRPQRHAENRAQVVLELAGRLAAQGPVPAVVHPGGQLVDQQALPHHEALHGQYADVVHRRQ